MEQFAMSLMVLGIVVGSFLFVGWLVWMVSRQRRERQQNEIELRARMLDKFGTSEDFVGFMQTDAGRKFLETGAFKKGKSMRLKVASSLSTGVILVMLGGAFFFMAARIGQTELMFPGSILSAIGIGLVLSAYIYSRFARDDQEDQ